MSVPHPHDVFVRDFLADLDQARDFFRLLLPPAFQAEFDLDALRAEPTSLIDETLNELQSDLLFSLTTHAGEPRQLYLLFEHKSYLENAMLTAAQQLYERGHREGEAKLPREQLEYKFGAPPKRIQQRLAEADEADLRTWSLRLLTATALDEVFPKTPRRRPPA